MHNTTFSPLGIQVKSPMYASSAISLPTSFAHEHRPLRATSASESTRPQPTGECNFVLLHPSNKNQQCPCQIYQHNRSAPGNVCDCGHASCYHAHSFSQNRTPQNDNSILTNGLMERIQRLEETLQRERDLRDRLINTEKQAREKDIRMLREALTPFYRTEREVNNKLVELEDKLEHSLDEQVRVKDKILAIDEANMAFERRVEDSGILETHNTRAHQLSSSGDDRNPTYFEPLSPHSAHIAEPESPRSSGILNLLDQPRQSPSRKTLTMQERQPTMTNEEPRSSGFLSIDIRDRAKQRKPTVKANMKVTSPNPQMPTPRSAPASVTGRSPMSPPKMSPPDASRSVEPVRKRRKQQDGRMPLDVLADLSANSPLVP